MFFRKKALNTTGKVNKYGNKKTPRIINGVEVMFSSKLEADCYDSLMEYYNKGIITKLERQVIFELNPGYIQDQIQWNSEKLPVKIGRKSNRYFMTIEKNKKIQKIKYLADFVITTNNGSELVIDAKGKETADFKNKRKLFESKYNRPLICIGDPIIKELDIFIDFMTELGYFNK